MIVKEKRLLGAGPSNPPKSVLSALSGPMMGHLHPETLQVSVIHYLMSLQAFIFHFVIQSSFLALQKINDESVYSHRRHLSLLIVFRQVNII